MFPVRHSSCKTFVLALIHCLIPIECFFPLACLPRNGKRATVVSKDESAGRWEAHKGTMFTCLNANFTAQSLADGPHESDLRGLGTSVNLADENDLCGGEIRWPCR